MIPAEDVPGFLSGDYEMMDYLRYIETREESEKRKDEDEGMEVNKMKS